MAIFGDVTLILKNNYTLMHGADSTDKLMNDVCGAIFVIIVIIGLTVNPYLYYYYHRFKTSWICRFFRYLSISHFCYTLIRSIPTAYNLLKSGKPAVTYMESIKIDVMIPAMFSYLFGLSMITTVAVIAIVQYSQIHQPLWSMVYGNQFKKTMFTMSVIFCFCWFGGFALLQGFLPGNCIWLNAIQTICVDPTTTIIQLLALAPLFIGVCVSAIVYLVTIVGFRTDPELVLTRRIRREFVVVGLLGFGNVLWLGLNVYNSVDLFKMSMIKYEDLYVMFITFTMIPCVVSAYNALVIFFSDPEIRQRFFICSICQRGDGYQTID